MKRALLCTLMLTAALAFGCGGSNSEAANPDEAANLFSEPQRDQFWVLVAFTDTLETPDVRQEPELIKVVIVGFALASNAASTEPLLAVRLNSSDRAHFYLVTKDTFDKFAAGKISAEAFLQEIVMAESEATLQQVKARLAGGA